MKIGIDAKRLFLNYTGLGNYSRFIMNGLLEYFPENEYRFFSPRVKTNKETEGYFNNVKVDIITPSFPYDIAPMSNIWRSYALTNEPEFKTLDVFHGLGQELPIGIQSGIKKVVTVYDLIFLRYPEFYGKINTSIYKLKTEYACKQADQIIAISENTKSDIIEFFKINENKISVVYLGCDPIYSHLHTDVELNEIRIKYNLPKNYILNVGTIEERKNLLLIVKALALISPENRPHLVVLGRKTDYFKQVEKYINENNLTDNIHVISKAEFKDFPAIYQQASIFIYPSLYEGFGIPIIEAIQSNVPVITSIGSCLHEAAGPAAKYIDPKNEHKLAEAISSMLAENQETRIAQQKNHIRAFDSKIIAEQIFQLYSR